MLLADQNRIQFAMGVHNHQPVGNWDRVIEDGYQHSYLPFIDVLERHPGVQMSIHYAGHLLAWLGRHHPEFLERIRAMVARGQLEIVTGPYYEPVLGIVPDDDKIGQIRHLTQAVHRATGYEAQGMWLTGRIWEPHLAKPIAEAGVRHVVLDDTHFRAAGLRGPELFGYYQTEEQGAELSVFAISRQLRAMIPFHPPEKVIDYLRSHATPDGSRLALFFDDGEKFGGWPNTYKPVYIDGWLDRFFGLIEEHRDWITSTTVQGYREAHKPWGRLYLPTCANLEMQAWALPPEQTTLFEEARANVDPRYVEFLRGGYWRHFLIKYPESNQMHKKMLRVASQVKAAAGVEQAVPVGAPASVVDTLTEAREALWRGQSNDPYWHGVYGGIYLNHLRAANYGALLQAETRCDRLRHGDGEFCELEVTDFDRDGSVEALVSTRTQNLYLTPGYGGALFEHDYKPRHINLLDTMARRPEAYHAKISRAIHAQELVNLAPTAIGERVVTKESGLERLLHYDWYRRLSLLDHFIHPDTRLETFHNMSYGEQGDFINQPYELSTREGDHGVIIRLVRDGHVWVGPEFWPIRVEKQILVPREGAGFVADYTITNLWDRPLEVGFGVEFNLNMHSADSPACSFFSETGRHIEPLGLAAMAQEESIAEIGVRNAAEDFEVHFAWSEPATLWRFPIETVSRSEAGFERVYQSSVLFPHWRLALSASGSWSCRVEQQVKSL
ncbi:MAG TPA: alpha-amylase/4-alpha-glucanotransferase domain-containing protein [Oscillatoriaceae cyanobacterium]